MFLRFLFVLQPFSVMMGIMGKGNYERKKYEEEYGDIDQKIKECEEQYKDIEKLLEAQ